MVLVSGVFTFVYAAAGVILRGRVWKVFIPVFAVHMLLINLLNKLMPSVAQPATMSAAGVAALQTRLSFDAGAIIVPFFGLLVLPLRVNQRGQALLAGPR
jgi:hypothetical protein